MRVDRTLKTAFNALSRNPMRAILTTLGIIIGIAAVIAMVEIGNGSAAAIQKTIASMGANNLLVLPGSANAGGVSFGSGTGMTLTPEDCDAVLRECPEVRDAAPIIRVRTQVVYGNRNCSPIFIYGTTPAFLNVHNWNDMAEGAAFTDADVRNASKVCVIGQTVAHDLFDDESPIGQEIRVQNVTFKIVGVLSPRGANMMGTDQDDILLAPWRTIKFRVSGSSAQVGNQSAASSSSTAINTLNQLYPSTSLNLFDAPSTAQQADTPLPVRFINVDQILISAAAPEEIPMAIREVNSLLRERHHLPERQEEDFQVINITEMRKAFTSSGATMTRLLLAVACISLVVGGVGIMNIMLVSVTERTREIGLRMAVGARGATFSASFSPKPSCYASPAAQLASPSASAQSWLVTKVLDWPTVSSPLTIIVAFIVSALVGIVFGFYPAWKASNLDPIDALRYE